jgi:hypothetical protein
MDQNYRRTISYFHVSRWLLCMYHSQNNVYIYIDEILLFVNPFSRLPIFRLIGVLPI